MMRLGSICSGYGGLDLAAEHLFGASTAWYAEFDPSAAKVFGAHWPGLPNHGDITTVDWDTVESVDVLAGGVPCQGWSLAGKQQGSDDDRDLWPVRKTDEDGKPRRGAVDTIRSLRPALFLFENVPGILTAEAGVPFGTVLADLDELGYAASWTVVGACKVGACHHRHRVYLAAVRLDVVRGTTVRPGGTPFAFRDGAAWMSFAAPLFGPPAHVDWPQAGVVIGGQVWSLPADPCGAGGVVTMLPTPTARIAQGRGTPSAETARRRLEEQGKANLEDAIAMLPTPTARDSSRGAGRAFAEGRPLSEVVALLPTPTASDTAGSGLTGTGGLNLRTAVAMLPKPRASGADKGGPNQRGSSGDVALPAAVQSGRFGAYEAAVRRHEQAFGIHAPEPTEPGRLGRPRLAPAFPEWMQGLPHGWISDHVPRKDAIRIAGNGVVPAAAAYAYSTLPTVRAFLAVTASVAA